METKEEPVMRRHVEVITYALARAAADKARRRAYPPFYSGFVLKETRTHMWLREDHGDRRVIALPFNRITDVQEL